MEKEDSKNLISSLQKLHLKNDEDSRHMELSMEKPNFHLQEPKKRTLHSCKTPRTRSLVNLCLGILGQHFEDIIEDLAQIAATFPPHIKMAMMAMARRRRLLNDSILIALVDSTWDTLDISESDVSDLGLTKVASMLKTLRAIDISRCSKVTFMGVSEIVHHCRSLEILRWGGCPRSDFTARRSLDILKPKLNDVEGESWEELASMDIVDGAESLRWLIWPTIDDDSRLSLTECPRILLNPKPSPFALQVPYDALPDISLDDRAVKDIDPKTWEVCGISQRPRVIGSSSSALTPSTDLPIAEKFRLAFVERDTRLAPKRAKNARQHRRRAEREWVMSNTDAKSVALATQIKRSLHSSKS